MFKTTLLTIQKYWKVLLLILSAIVGFVVFRNRGTSFVSDYLKIKKIHEDKVNAIKEIKNTELAKHQQNRAEFDDKIKTIELESNKKQADLDTKKQVERNELASKDVNGLANEVSNVTGFKVIMPKDDE